MALEGTLRDFSLADIFQLIGLQRKTGVLTLNGSDDTVTVSSEIAGKVDKVLAEVGDRVTAGAPLAEVDRETFKIYLQQAEANNEFESARRWLARANRLLENAF